MDRRTDGTTIEKVYFKTVGKDSSKLKTVVNVEKDH